jgi:hypothetical protein
VWLLNFPDIVGLLFIIISIESNFTSVDIPSLSSMGHNSKVWLSERFKSKWDIGILRPSWSQWSNCATHVSTFSASPHIWELFCQITTTAARNNLPSKLVVLTTVLHGPAALSTLKTKSTSTGIIDNNMNGNWCGSRLNRTNCKEKTGDCRSLPQNIVFVYRETWNGFDLQTYFVSKLYIPHIGSLSKL